MSLKPEDQKWLDDLPGNFKRDLYKGIAKAMLFTEAASKSSFGKLGNLKVDTGLLRRSIKSESSENTGRLSSNVIYAAIHELGGIIRPKNAAALRFKVGGAWRSAKKVIMPARPFLRPAFEENMDEISEIILGTILKGMKDEQ